jgi:hypothetical protein
MQAISGGTLVSSSCEPAGAKQVVVKTGEPTLLATSHQSRTSSPPPGQAQQVSSLSKALERTLRLDFMK